MHPKRGGWQGLKGQKLEEGGPPVNHLDTNLLELQAEHYLPSSHLGPMSKTTTVAYVDNMRGDKSIEVDSWAQEILEWAIKRDNWLTAVHTPGKPNVGVD